jgi:hypothetical protein
MPPDIRYVQSETLPELASTCHDAFVGREMTPYDIPSRSHVHKNELPADGYSTPWEMWKRVAEAVQNWPIEDLKVTAREQVALELFRALEGQVRPTLEAERWAKIRDHMGWVADLALKRAQILSPH